MKLIGHGGPAHLCAAFEHQRSVSGLGQIERGDQPVVAAANDDNVAPLGAFLYRHGYAAPLMSFRISSAANRPFAPMIPPPGCVADPHMYRFLMGVRY